MPISASLGHASVAVGKLNQDFVGMATPVAGDLATKGIVAAVADGVSSSGGAREAAEYTVRGLLADYYATPDTWDIGYALEVVLQAINRWLLAQSTSRRELAGMVTTLTALVLRGRHYHVAHVGDSRAYLFRSGALRRLTEDHVWDQPHMQHVLRRAMGLDPRLSVDHASDELAAGDVFLLATDGVWSALRDETLAKFLAQVAQLTLSTEHAADRIVEAARRAGSADDASAAVARVDGVPESGLQDVLTDAHRLPLPPRLKPGEELDGLVVEELLHASSATLLYRVRDAESGSECVLKTLAPERAGDPLEREGFAREEWIVRRLAARCFPQYVARPLDRQSCLYFLTTWHAGSTLQSRIDAGRHFTVPDAVHLMAQLARALGVLHRRGIVHRDIKPANVHLGDDGELRLMDFGVAQSNADDPDEAARAPRAGTPSFLAPEQFAGAAASPQTDLYAAGVTLYCTLTRRYPYGEIEPFQTPRFGEPVSAARYRPDLPAWLDHLLHKAVAREPAERFETAEELLLALERGAARPLPAPRPIPLARRHSVLLWRAIAWVSLAVNAVLAYLLFGR